MPDKESLQSRSREAKLLDTRIAENTAAQEIDLVSWIFERIPVKRGDRVLELCCGTGSQTLRLVDLVGEKGKVVAVDISKDALDTVKSKLNASQKNKTTTLEANLDKLGEALDKAGLQEERFDLIFCAYGLYYGAEPKQVLQEAKNRLNQNGRIVIVGPFGPNNFQLFAGLRKIGVDIPPFVIYASQDFMYQLVVPWAAENFSSIHIATVVNHTKWTSPESIMNYWKNTIFYEAKSAGAFNNLLIKHFKNHTEFINEKWIMLVEMIQAKT
jgi:ubiquinone/menaquinone biosynthesis C-methylase UbiE